MWALNQPQQSGVFGQPDCRKYEVPTCEADVNVAPNATVPAIATFTIKQRDTIDFTVDWSSWLGANGNPVLTNATWTVATDSPKTPTISGQAFSAAGVCVAVLTPAAGATPGDAYWLDLTVTVGVTTATNAGDVAIPARTLVRRVYIIVTAG